MPQRLVIRGQRWQMHACCMEGVASNRCVKLPTVDPLSHLRIDWLRRTELRHRKSGPIRHLHAFACQQRGCVLGCPNTLGSGWWSLQFLEKLRANLWCSGMHLGGNCATSATSPTGTGTATSGHGPNYGTIPMPTFASRPLTTSSTIPVESPQNYVVGQQRQMNVGIRPDPKHRFQMVLIFRRQLCYGSKKWRWLILWTT